jgi:hypothetical protein
MIITFLKLNNILDLFSLVKRLSEALKWIILYNVNIVLF